MERFRLYIAVLAFFFIGSASMVHGQNVLQRKPTPIKNEVSKTDTTKVSLLYVDRADRQLFDASGVDEKLNLWGNVRITHDNVFMYCDSAVLVNNNLSAKGNISIIKNDTIRIFSDSLLYLGDSLMAYFVGNVVLEEGDQQLFTSFLQYDIEKDWAIYTDTALLLVDEMEIKSKRGIFHVNENFVNFYEKVTIEGEDFELYTDSLRYYTELKRSVFLSPTLIIQADKRIYSEGGYYDSDDKESLFFGNAQILEKDKTSTADTIKNFESKQLIELIGNAKYESSDEIGKANKIIYHSELEDFELIGNAYFKNPENEVTGESINYSKSTENVKVSGRSFLSKPPMLIYADDLDYRKNGGVAVAIGNVIWKDTSSHYEIICDHATYLDSTEFMKAYNFKGKPMLINEFEVGDTLFLSGDTLISYAKYIEEDTFRFFSAFEHVEMINKKMQAVSDSLSYDGRDSVFTLFGVPIMWSDSSQYNGDTIIISMSKNQIEKVYLLDNAMILTTKDFQFFDQIKGKRIDALFNEGSLESMFVTGNSQSVYYMKDEDEAYIGVNETKCSNMNFLFENGNLIQTRYYKEPTSKLTPMNKANHETIKLSGFNWQLTRRPLSIEDLYY